VQRQRTRDLAAPTVVRQLRVAHSEFSGAQRCLARASEIDWPRLDRIDLLHLHGDDHRTTGIRPGNRERDLWVRLLPVATIEIMRGASWSASDDTATTLLMGRFYDNLLGSYQDSRAGRVAEPLPKAKALREAKRWLRTYTDAQGHQPFAHPVYCSAFVLIGDPD